MTTKTCEKCGWVCAIQDPSNFCPICKTKFKHGICYHCRRPVEFYRPNVNICKECFYTYTKPLRADTNDHRMRRRRRDAYEEWRARIAKVPRNYPTLTEAQWIEAVSYFNGCALCECEEVDTRWYFIPLKLGGRYCNWNIIPVCAKCATKIRGTPNYFLYERPVGLINIINYLEERLDAALATSPETGQQSNNGATNNQCTDKQDNK